MNSELKYSVARLITVLIASTVERGETHTGAPTLQLFTIIVDDSLHLLRV